MITPEVINVNVPEPWHSVIAELQRALAQAREEIERLNNRHVQFMVQGGPVVMAVDHEKVLAERDTLKARVEQLENQYVSLTDGLWEAFGGEDRRDYVDQAKELRERLAAYEKPVTDEDDDKYSVHGYRYGFADALKEFLASRSTPKEGQ